MSLTWLCDIANDSGIKLDFSTGSDEGIQRALVLTHKFNVSRKKNIKKNKEELSKKVGSYLLFSICNELGESGMQPGIVLEGNSLKIQATGSRGNVETYDILGNAQKAIEQFRLSSPDEEFIVLGTLQPFYMSLVTEFLNKL